MRMIKYALAALAIGLAPTAASAATVIGGYSFEDDAFVDAVIDSSGSYSTSGGSLTSVLTDKNPGTFAFSFDSGAFLELGFVDNFAINGLGTDIVIFELGVFDGWDVAINGMTRRYIPASTGAVAGGFSLNAAEIDLSDFGLASGSQISSLRLSFINTGTVASTSLVGALNSTSVTAAIPEPGTWAMMLLGLAFVGGAIRTAKRRQRVAITYA